jgi:NADH dehydrogenase FAD-containing subunit
MTTRTAHPSKFRVLIVGGGVAALEATLALHDLAAEQVAVTVLAPNSEFVYRPMTVREPFAYGAAAHHPLAPILADIGAELIADSLGWVDHHGRIVHTTSDAPIAYDALVLALGARTRRCTGSSKTSKAATSTASRSSPPAAWHGHCRCTSSR